MTNFKKTLSIFLTVLTLAFASIAQLHSSEASLSSWFDTGRPVFRLGDWSSSGDMKLPYHPTYEFAYSCQAQLSDQISHKDLQDAGSGAARARMVHDYRFFAIADFTLRSGRTHVNSDRLSWFTVKFYGTHKIEPVDQKPPFATRGHGIGLSFDAAARPGEDIVSLELTLQQEMSGGEIVTQRKWTNFTRQDSRLIASVDVDVKDAHGKVMPNHYLRVVCEKER